MKIIAVLEDEVSSGGGFNQALNAIVQMRRICEGHFDFAVFTTHASNVERLRKLDVAAEVFSFSIVDRLLAHLSPYPWWHSLQLRIKLTGAFESRLLARGCDLVYFVTPSARSVALQRLNFITTVWDLCHRDAPEFPEVREFARFQAREHLYNTRLAAAFAILTDSPASTAAIARRYGIDAERLLPMPFAPAPSLQAHLANDKAAVLRKYALDEGYFFYPAQFWAHKNHIRILQALELLRQRGQRVQAVFAGGDQGNRAHIEKFVDQHALREQVHLLGFVPAEDMRGLYEGCAAVVMPTYFGPTNVPPLEAWMLGKPLIYSSHFREQVGEAAICVDPDDPKELAEGMQACGNSETCANLVRLGKLRFKQVEAQRDAAEAELRSRLQRFEARRACWP